MRCGEVLAVERTMRLADLRPGVGAEIRALSGHPAFRRRMLGLGITPGSLVQVLRAMPCGGPLEIEARGTRLALRLADAQRITVAVRT